jgi:hypothetical protein
MTINGTIRNGVVVLAEGVSLPEGTRVTVATVDQTDSEPSAPARAPTAGSAKGKVVMSPDFDEPLEDFAEYME